MNLRFSGLSDKTPTCGHNRGTPKARQARFGEPPTTPTAPQRRWRYRDTSSKSRHTKQKQPSGLLPTRLFLV